MGWHYAARKTVQEDGEEFYELVEVYPDLVPELSDYLGVDAPPCSFPAHTENAVSVVGSSREDLAEWLRRAALDVLEYPVIEPANGESIGLSCEQLKEVFKREIPDSD